MSTHQESDFGTPETQQHGGGIIKGYTADGGKVGRVKHQTPFDTLYDRGRISDKQWQAGERLRQDAYVAGKFSYVKSSADFSIKGNITDQAADFIADAGKRYNDRIGALSQQEKAIMLLIVIEEGAVRYITDYKLRLVAMDVLRSGLDVLIKEYGV